MKKIIALSAILITLSIALIAFILFYIYVNENVGGFGMVITFFSIIFVSVRLIEESSNQ